MSIFRVDFTWNDPYINIMAHLHPGPSLRPAALVMLAAILLLLRIALRGVIIYSSCIIYINQQSLTQHYKAPTITFGE